MKRRKKKLTHCVIYYTEQKNSRRPIASCVCGWFLTTPDGKHYEDGRPQRPPDFVIPLPTASTAGAIYRSGMVELPPLKFKMICYIYGRKIAKLVDQAQIKTQAIRRTLIRVRRSNNFLEKWEIVG